MGKATKPELEARVKELEDAVRQLLQENETLEELVYLYRRLENLRGGLSQKHEH